MEPGETAHPHSIDFIQGDRGQALGGRPCRTAARPLLGPVQPPPLFTQQRTFGTAQRSAALGHEWTVPAVQEDSDVLAKRSGAAMYPACFRLEDYLCRDAAAMAAGPDVIR